MNRIRKLNPILLLVLALGLTGLVIAGGYARLAHAQAMIQDQTSGFWGTLINTGANATVVSATTLSKQVNGPAQPNPPGFTSPSARIHLKHIHGVTVTSQTLQFLEHPTTGADIFICNMTLGANLPNDVAAGQNSVLGLNGYITAPGSSIRVLATAATSVTGLNFTYTLE